MNGRVQMRRGVKLPPGARSVIRGTPWGNPFKVGARVALLEHPYVEVVLTAPDAVALFETYATRRLADDPTWLEPLRGHDLACYCQPWDPCHADWLVAEANRGIAAAVRQGAKRAQRARPVATT